MKNPIALSTPTLTQFGFIATFNLYDNTILIDWGISTVFKVGGQASVQRIGFEVIDPAGAVIYNEEIIQPINPDLMIEVDISRIFLFGFYTIKGWIVDQDGKRYEVLVTKQVCQPEDWSKDHIKGNFDVNVNCLAPKVQLTEVTKLAYLGKSPVHVANDGVLYYPENVLIALPFSFTPFIIGSAGGLYTGTYTVRNLTMATYDLGNQVYVILPYKYSKEFNVECSTGLSDILCCVNDIQDLATNECSNAKGRNATEKLNAAGPYMMLAALKEIAGKSSSREVSKIKEILNCDCGCDGSESVAPRLIAASGTATNYSVVGLGAVTVTDSTVGYTKQFSVMVKTVSVVKADVADGNFSITKVDSAISVRYELAFDYKLLSQTVLNTILNDATLVDLFNQIVDTSTGLSLDSIDGKCVVDLSSLSYSITESFLQMKTVKSILINGTTYTAPGSLSLNSGTDIQAWLNSLALGNFVVSVDLGTKNTTISSADNVNIISSLTLTADGSDIVKVFDRSSGSIESIFQAIIDYLCTLTTLKITIGQELELCSLDSQGAIVKTKYGVDKTLQTYLSAINTNFCNLVGQVKAVTTVDCAKMKTIFKSSTDPLVTSDVIYGTKGDVCARITLDEFTEKILTRISENETLKTILCEISRTCSTPVCAPPTNVSGSICFGATCSPIEDINGDLEVPVTVTYSLTKDSNPHVDALIGPIVNGVFRDNIYGTGFGPIANVFAGQTIEMRLLHSVEGNPWPAGSSARMIVKANGVVAYDSGDVTVPNLVDLGLYTWTAMAGVVYEVIVTSNSVSTAYNAVSFSMFNNSSAPLSQGWEVVNFEFIDNTDGIRKLFAGQNINPHENVGFNWLADAGTGKLIVNNNSAFSLTFTLSNIPHGGAYSVVKTIASGASGEFLALPKSGYTITYVNA